MLKLSARRLPHAAKRQLTRAFTTAPEFVVDGELSVGLKIPVSGVTTTPRLWSLRMRPN